MCLKLKFLTCPACKGHSYNSYSHNGDDYATVNCPCGHDYKDSFQYKTVDYPDVTILGETFNKLDVEKEIFYNKTTNDAPFGVNVKLKFHKESHYYGRRSEIRYNATEFHYMYKPLCTVFLEQGVAIESDIHYHGGTLDISHIKSIVITKATKKHKSH